MFQGISRARGRSSVRILHQFVRSAQYSRKSDPKNSENAYKVVKARVRLEGNTLSLIATHKNIPTLHHLF